MNTYGFEVAHGYEILKGFVEAESKAQAIQKTSDKDWNDIIDTYDCDEFTESYKILDVWECEIKVMTDYKKLCGVLRNIGCKFSTGNNYIEIHPDSMITFGGVCIDFYDDGSFEGFAASE